MLIFHLFTPKSSGHKKASFAEKNCQKEKYSVQRDMKDETPRERL